MDRKKLTSIGAIVALALAHVSPTEAVAAGSPWGIKVTGQSCDLTESNISDCRSTAWVYNKNSGDIYNCIGIQYSKGLPSVVKRNVTVRCQKLNVDDSDFYPNFVGGIEVGANGFIVRADEERDRHGNEVGPFESYVWLAGPGENIDALHFCATSFRPIECSDRPTFGPKINVKVDQ